MSDDDKDLFRKAMANVKPLRHSGKRKKSTTAQTTLRNRARPLQTPEALAPNWNDHILNPVTANDTVHYQAEALTQQLQRQLRNGKLRIQARLDLHGFRVEDAKQELFEFLTYCQERHFSCVLIVHGKGAFSAEPAKIKNAVCNWLQQEQKVLAYHSCIPADGGTGAIYVLLRKPRVGK